MRELRHALSQLRLNDLAIGSDGRNRTLLSAFQARTGRNQPSNSRSIFGPSVWLRGLIQPKPGTALAYVDWGQQEFGIGAALSEDPMMLEAYSSGDPYLEFAKQAGAVPPKATKDSHGEERELFKACALAVQYGMGEQSLAYRIGRPPIEARELLRKHRETYRRFWEWSDRIVTYAMVMNSIRTAFGWPLHVSREPNERSLRNFPMQANGAEMLRLACCLATERGIRVCMPVHDAILIEADADKIDDAITATKTAMAEASRVVLNGFELRSDVKVIQQNERYSDKRGETMWNRVMNLLSEAESRLLPTPSQNVAPAAE
jgi:DNA polymerase I-like protein with 3'-5' exonuclease and polymerase domains